jgi:hypothetical protein
MSLQTRLSELISAIGTDVKSLAARVTTLEGSSGGGGATPDIHNTSVANQNLGVGDTYIVGSAITIPTGKLKAKSMYRCKIQMVKTAAGVGGPVFNLRVGTLGTVADALVASYTAAAQTAAADDGTFEIDVVFRSAGATTVPFMLWKLAHRLVTTGFSVTATNVIAAVAGSSFNGTGAGLIIGVSIAPGVSAAWSTNVVEASLINLA